MDSELCPEYGNMDVSLGQYRGLRPPPLLKECEMHESAFFAGLSLGGNCKEHVVKVLQS